MGLYLKEGGSTLIRARALVTAAWDWTCCIRAALTSCGLEGSLELEPPKRDILGGVLEY